MLVGKFTSIVFLASVQVAAGGCEAGASEQGRAPVEISEDQLATQENGQDVFPSAFRGKWATNLAACNDQDGKGSVQITDRRFSSYEFDAVMLKNSLSFHAGPNGELAHTILALVAQSAEGDVGIGKLRVSLSDNKLYQSDAENSEDQHWKYPAIRCRP